MHTFYPVPAQNYELHITSVDCTLIHCEKKRDLPRSHMGMNLYEQWHIQKLAARYLKLCNGFNSHNEICKQLKAPFPPLLERIARSLAESTGVIELRDNAVSDSAPQIFITGSFDSFAPLHISVEITDTCNFECDHCYVSASPYKKEKRALTELTELFDSMHDNGVKVIEITGGECTTHPQFKKILQYASDKFHLVAVVTNGYLPGKRPELAKFIGSFPNTCVQVSIDGLQEFHDPFRKHDGSFHAACEAIKYFKAEGTIVRIGMSVTRDNLDQVEGVFRLAKELNVDAFSAAPVSSFGRGKDLGMCNSTDNFVKQGISDALSEFSGDRLFEANRISTENLVKTAQNNCGAGWRTFGLNGATGEVRSCLYLADSKKFGSVDKQSYSDIFERPEMRMFRDAPSPSPLLETCKNCEYSSQCSGCFAKAFQVSESEFPECPWRKMYFPGMELNDNAAGSEVKLPINIPLRKDLTSLQL